MYLAKDAAPTEFNRNYIAICWASYNTNTFFDRRVVGSEKGSPSRPIFTYVFRCSGMRSTEIMVGVMSGSLAPIIWPQPLQLYSKPPNWLTSCASAIMFPSRAQIHPAQCIHLVPRPTDLSLATALLLCRRSIGPMKLHPFAWVERDRRATAGTMLWSRRGRNQ
jgi:hypothetical protein